MDSQQSEAEPMAVEDEAHKDNEVTTLETKEEVLTLTSEQPVVTDDGGSTFIMSSVTSEVVVEHDEEQKEDETKPEDNEEVVVGGEEDEEEDDDNDDEEEEDEEEEEEEEEDVEIEQLSGFEVTTTSLAATNEVTAAEVDTGFSKSDLIELSSDEETDRVPAVMLSSAARSVVDFTTTHTCTMTLYITGKMFSCQ